MPDRPTSHRNNEIVQQKQTDDEINALANYYAAQTGWPGKKPEKKTAAKSSNARLDHACRPKL